MSEDDVHSLREELARCKADKEFVWSLWKQLQTNSPEISDAISLVVKRENAKRIKEHEELLERLESKENEIKELHKELDRRVEILDGFEAQINKFKSDKLSNDSKLQKEREQHRNEIDKMSMEMNELKSTLYEKEKQMEHYQEKFLEEFTQLQKQEVLLKQQLQKKNKEYTRHITSLDNRIESLENELKESNQKLMEKLQHIEEMKTVHHEELKVHESQRDVLVNEKYQLEDEVQKLNKQIKISDSRNGSQYSCHGNLVAPSITGISNDNQLKKLLETTEEELFNVKTELQAKDDELMCLREKHSRRLERMNILKETHNLTLKQLKTYESNPEDDDKPHPPSPPTLIQENTDRVWNELAQYKRLYNELQIKKMSTDEELDTVSLACARYKSTISELRTCLTREKSELEKKKYSIMESESLELKKKVSENIELMDENEKLKEFNKLMNSKCCQLQDEILSLQKVLDEMPKEKEVLKLNDHKSTMTEGVATASCDISTQTIEEAPPQQVAMATSVSSTALSDNQCSLQTRTNASRTHSHSRRHRRRHSDTSLITSYQQMTRALEKVNRISQTICEPPDKLPQQKSCDQRKIIHESSSCKASFNGSTQLWMAQVKNYQHQINRLMKQIGILTIAKNSLSDSLDKCQDVKIKMEKETKILKDKITSQKQTIHDLRRDMKKLEDVHSRLQRHCQELEMIENDVEKGREKAMVVEKENKQLKDSKAAINDKCNSLWSQVKSLQTEIIIKDKEKLAVEERCCSFEKEIKRKKQLMIDYKKRLSSLSEKNDVDQEKMKCLEDKLKTLSDSLEQYKHRINSVKSQSEHHSKEKQMLSSLLSQCQDELKETNVKLASAQHECVQKSKKLVCLKEASEKKEEELKNHHRLSLLEMKRKMEIAEKFAQHYQDFVLDLAQLLSDMQDQKFNRRMAASDAHRYDQEIITERARRIAQTAFDLSDSEVDDLMSYKPLLVSYKFIIIIVVVVVVVIIIYCRMKNHH
jgi:centlein